MGCGTLSRKEDKQPIKLTILLRPGQFISNLNDNIYSHYTIKHELGSGAYGRVVYAIHNITHQDRAIKIINKFSIKNEQIRSKLMNEVNILKNLDHPNIIKIYEFYEDEFNLYLVLDICTGGELLESILKRGSFSEVTAALYMRQILSTVVYLHNQRIIHRDLKLENMLLESPQDTGLKIIDFGAATNYVPGKLESLRVGTVNYIAPEVLAKKYNEKCDIWSCGVILFILLSGRLPFKAKDKIRCMNLIQSGKYSIEGGVWDLISLDAKNLLIRMLEKNPKKRISAYEAFQHPWIQESILPKLQQNLLDIASNNLKSFHETSKLQRAVIRFIGCQLLKSVEKKELSDIYKSLDTEGQGKLSEEQLGYCWKRIFGSELSDEDLKKMMMRVDTDKSGFIEYSEFIVAAMDRKRLLSSERLDEVFNTFDRDHNGKISALELKTMLDYEQDLDLSLYMNVIKEADLNGDGQIDYAEFKNAMLSLVN